MSEPRGTAPEGAAGNRSEQHGRGLNLTVIYSLIVLAMLAAIVFAALIVLPFYHRR